MKRVLKIVGILFAAVLFGAVIGLMNAFRGTAEQKATGPGAVAGGVSEALVSAAIFLLAVVVLLSARWMVRRIRQP